MKVPYRGKFAFTFTPDDGLMLVEKKRRRDGTRRHNRTETDMATTDLKQLRAELRKAADTIEERDAQAFRERLDWYPLAGTVEFLRTLSRKRRVSAFDSELWSDFECATFCTHPLKQVNGEWAVTCELTDDCYDTGGGELRERAHDLLDALTYD